MLPRSSGPGPQEKRLAAYLDGLARAAGHADRHEPLKDYCKGLLLPGERMSIKAMAARLRPGRVQAARHPLHPLVAKAGWSEGAVLAEVRRRVLPVIEQRGAIVACIADDTGIPKKGRHSVGVARQSCGQLGRQDSCQVPVSLSVAVREVSLPLGWRRPGWLMRGRWRGMDWRWRRVFGVIRAGSSCMIYTDTERRRGLCGGERSPNACPWPWIRQTRVGMSGRFACLFRRVQPNRKCDHPVRVSDVRKRGNIQGSFPVGVHWTACCAGWQPVSRAAHSGARRPSLAARKPLPGAALIICFVVAQGHRGLLEPQPRPRLRPPGAVAPLR